MTFLGRLCRLFASCSRWFLRQPSCVLRRAIQYRRPSPRPSHPRLWFGHSGWRETRNGSGNWPKRCTPKATSPRGVPACSRKPSPDLIGKSKPGWPCRTLAPAVMPQASRARNCSAWSRWWRAGRPPASGPASVGCLCIRRPGGGGSRGCSLGRLAGGPGTREPERSRWNAGPTGRRRLPSGRPWGFEGSQRTERVRRPGPPARALKTRARARGWLGSSVTA
jgi:hypothetical protein